MEIYNYTKKIDPEVLLEAIQLRTSLRPKLLGVNISQNPDGSVPDDNITIEMTEALLSAEIDELTIVINAIDASYDLMVRKKIERDVIKWATAMGNMVLNQFASNNLYRGKTDEEIDSIIEDNSVLIHSLNTGSLTKAYREFLALETRIVGGEVVVGITLPEVQEFKLRMQIILGL